MHRVYSVKENLVKLIGHILPELSYTQEQHTYTCDSAVNVCGKWPSLVSMWQHISVELIIN